MSAPYKIAFVVSSDTHLQIASEIAEAACLLEDYELVGSISLRPFFGQCEYPRHSLKNLGPCSIRLSHTPLSIGDKILSRVHRLASKLGISQKGHEDRKQAAQFVGGSHLPQIDAVFVMNDRAPIEQWWIRRFQMRGVKVCLVQESLRRDLAMALSPNGLAHGQGGCDLVFAWGQTSIQYFEQVGVSRRRLFLSGSPRIDRMLREHADLPSANALRSIVGIPTERPLILLATNPVCGMQLAKPLSQVEYSLQILNIAKWAHEIGALLLVKPHYLEISAHQQWGLPEAVTKHPGCFYLADFPLDESIRAANVVLVQNSTVAVEAALLGKPSGMIFPDSYGHGVDFMERGVSVPIRSREDLASLVLSAQTSLSPSCTEPYVGRTGDSARWILNHIRNT